MIARLVMLASLSCGALSLTGGCGGQVDTWEGGAGTAPAAPDGGAGVDGAGGSTAQGGAGASAGTGTAPSNLPARAELCPDGGTLVSIDIEPPTVCSALGLECGAACDPCWQVRRRDCSRIAAFYRCDRNHQCLAARD